MEKQIFLENIREVEKIHKEVMEIREGIFGRVKNAWNALFSGESETLAQQIEQAVKKEFATEDKSQMLLEEDLINLKK